MTTAQDQIIIAPSILSADFGRLAEEIKSIESAGADWIHIDVMDGSFVPPITFGDNMVSMAHKVTKLTLDAHLMIENPEKQINYFKDSGCNRLTFHFEATSDPIGLLHKIKELGMKGGISIKPETPVSAIKDVIPHADLVLIMTVNPGWSGQKFIPECLSKIKQAREIVKHNNSPALIQVDGGINFETAKECIAAGSTVLVAGSFIFNSKDRATTIRELRSV